MALLAHEAVQVRASHVASDRLPVTTVRARRTILGFIPFGRTQEYEVGGEYSFDSITMELGSAGWYGERMTTVVFDSGTEAHLKSVVTNPDTGQRSPLPKRSGYFRARRGESLSVPVTPFTDLTVVSRR